MKTILRLMLVASLFSLLVNEPPRQVEAEVSNVEVNNTQVENVPVTTVAVQTPTPEPKPIPKPQPIGCEHYTDLLSKYDWNTAVMARIMYFESRCNPNAVGDNYPIKGLHAPSCGLFQIRTLSSRPSCEQLKDPATNVEWAYKIYKGQGYKAWSVCKTKVQCY
jgi:hypothetical protein